MSGRDGREPEPLRVCDLTREHFGSRLRIGSTDGYLYAVHDDYNDGYPSRTLTLVDGGTEPPGSGVVAVVEFTDSNPSGYPKTMGTPVEVLES